MEEEEGGGEGGRWEKEEKAEPSPEGEETNAKSKLKFLGRFKLLGVPRVWGNHWKCMY